MGSDEIERLLVRVEANAAQFEGQMKRINKALGDSQKQTQRQLRQIKRDFDTAGRELGSSVIVPMQQASAVALAAMLAISINAAKRAEAVNGAFSQTFRDMPSEAQKAAGDIADEFKRLETDVKNNFTQMQSVLTALGVSGQQSLQIVDALQRRSLDIAAFKDIDDARAFQAVISGLTGETEPLKALGIVVNETAVKAELMRLGFKGNATQASEAAKAIARANIILQRSGEMQGQVAREGDTLAEQQKQVRTEFLRVSETFGKQFLPVAKDVLVWANKALTEFGKLPEGTKAAGLGMLALVAASGPIAAVVKGFQAIIGAAAAARAAIMSVPGAPGGGKGGVAPVVAGRGLLGTAALGAGLLTATGSFARAAPGDDAATDERLAYQRNRLQRLTNAGASDADLARVRRQVTALEGEKRRVDALYEGVSRFAQPDPDKAARDALAGLGDFGLSDAQKMGSGSAGGGRGGASSGPSAADLSARREALSLERALAIAQATGSEKAIKAEEERQTLIRLTQDYQEAGYTDAAAQALEHLSLMNAATIAAEEREKVEADVDRIIEDRQRKLEREADYQQQLYDQLVDRLSMEAQLASLRGDERGREAKERELWIEERINDLLRLRPSLTRGEARTTAEGEANAIDEATTRGRFVDMVVDAGTNFEQLTRRAGEGFKQKALEGFGNILFDLVQRAFAAMPNGGGTNFIKSLLDGIPGFATGTASAPGGLAYVHQGEVLTNLKAGTQVIPAHAVRALGALGDSQRGVVPGVASSGAGSLRVSVDVTGANGDAAVAAIAQAAARRGTEEAIAQSRADQAQATLARKYRLK